MHYHSDNTSLINYVTEKEVRQVKKGLKNPLRPKEVWVVAGVSISPSKKYIPLESGHRFQEDCQILVHHTVWSMSFLFNVTTDPTQRIICQSVNFESVSHDLRVPVFLCRSHMPSM